MRLGLTTKLMLSASVLLVAAIILVFGLWSALLYLKPAWALHHGMNEAVQSIARGLRFDKTGNPLSVELNQITRSAMDALPDDLLYEVIDANGKLLLGSSGVNQTPLETGLFLEGAPVSFDQSRRGVTLHVLRIPVEGTARTLYIVIACSERLQDALFASKWKAARATALTSTVTALIVFGTVVLFTIKHLLRTLEATSAAAARIAPGNLAARLDVSKVPIEIVPLIESFNAALERLERGYRVQKEFLATAAHELKTPLALMRGQIELGGPADQASLLKDVDHMARQVHQLLHLAEVSEAQNFRPERLNASEVVADAVAFLSRLTESRRVDVKLLAPEKPVQLLADRGALFVLVRNLVENAAHHSPGGSVITVSVDEFSISVRDQGPGFAALDTQAMFERFWRGAHRRDEGAGLGLSICEEIVQAHGWSIGATSTTASGAEFVVHFGAKVGSRLFSDRGPRAANLPVNRNSPETRSAPVRI